MSEIWLIVLVASVVAFIAGYFLGYFLGESIERKAGQEEEWGRIKGMLEVLRAQQRKPDE